jgi:hypothetical protein
MKTTVTYSLWAIFISLAMLACQTKDPVPTGQLRLAFDNVVGASDLKLGTGTYKNAAGESFVITKFNYYVSNIRLRRSDGTDYVVPQSTSYFLVQEDLPASQTIALTNVPTGDYTGISFLIGVDSLRSLADINERTGVLDPGIATHDPMYWDWNTGYIFMKMEGTSASAPAAQNNQFFYHVGGFGGGYNGKKTINNLRTVTLPFRSDVVSVQTSIAPTINLTTDALKVFNGPTQLSIGQHSAVMFEDYSANIATNYAQMITYNGMLAN